MEKFATLKNQEGWGRWPFLGKLNVQFGLCGFIR